MQRRGAPGDRRERCGGPRRVGEPHRVSRRGIGGLHLLYDRASCFHPPGCPPENRQVSPVLRDRDRRPGPNPPPRFDARESPAPRMNRRRPAYRRKERCSGPASTPDPSRPSRTRCPADPRARRATIPSGPEIRHDGRIAPPTTGSPPGPIPGGGPFFRPSACRREPTTARFAPSHPQRVCASPGIRPANGIGVGRESRPRLAMASKTKKGKRRGNHRLPCGFSGQPERRSLGTRAVIDPRRKAGGSIGRISGRIRRSPDA